MSDSSDSGDPLAEAASAALTGDDASTEEAPAPAAATGVPLLDMLDLDGQAEVAEPDVTIEREGVIVTGTDAASRAVSASELEHLCHLAANVLRAEAISRGRLDLHLVDREAITELNEEHLGGEGPTDVLAFPLNPDDFVAPAATADAPPMLGDVVLCPEVAAEQAVDHAGSVPAENALLVIHGVLHILGHDHAEDDERLAMQERERVHLSSVGFEHPVPGP